MKEKKVVWLDVSEDYAFCMTLGNEAEHAADDESYLFLCERVLLYSVKYAATLTKLHHQVYVV